MDQGLPQSEQYVGKSFSLSTISKHVFGAK